MSYTFIDPTIFYELAYDTAVLARERGLNNNFVTNGFISEVPLRELATVLDAANVDLKFFKEETYRRISRARLQPILDAIRLYYELGVWIEVTTLVIPGINDSDEELTQIAEFVCSVGPEVPWHVSAFYPSYKMIETPPTSAARAFCRPASPGKGSVPALTSETVPALTSAPTTWCPREAYWTASGGRLWKGLLSDTGAPVDGADPERQ